MLVNFSCELGLCVELMVVLVVVELVDLGLEWLVWVLCMFGYNVCVFLYYLVLLFFNFS